MAKALIAELIDQTWVLTLARPTKANALDADAIEQLHHAVTHPPTAARRLVLRGQGPSFCAGADLRWMAQGEGDAPAAALAAVLEALDRCELAVVGLAHGHVLGGGVGLLCCCDVVVASADARFGLVEATVGLAPALIAPMVVRRIGAAAARRAFTHAQLFDGPQALQMGLIDVLCDDLAAAQAHIDGPLWHSLRRCGPAAVAAAKQVVRTVEAGRADPAATTAALGASLATLRAGAEARAGIAAFFARQKAPWA